MRRAKNFTLPAAWFHWFSWTGYWRRSLLSGSMVVWISSAGTVPETLVLRQKVAIDEAKVACVGHGLGWEAAR